MRYLVVTLLALSLSGCATQGKISNAPPGEEGTLSIKHGDSYRIYQAVWNGKILQFEGEDQTFSLAFKAPQLEGELSLDLDRRRSKPFLGKEDRRTVESGTLTIKKAEGAGPLELEAEFSLTTSQGVETGLVTAKVAKFSGKL